MRSRSAGPPRRMIASTAVHVGGRVGGGDATRVILDVAGVDRDDAAGREQVADLAQARTLHHRRQPRGAGKRLTEFGR